MWRDVFLSNKEAVLEMLGRFSEDLTALQRAIRWDDGEQLEKVFTRTRDVRRGVIEARQAGRFQYTENGGEEGDDGAKE
jgi:cyclohexadieny/prephenate dehydrogenase